MPERRDGDCTRPMAQLRMRTMEGREGGRLVSEHHSVNGRSNERIDIPPYLD